MDAIFAAAMERAFARGLECRSSASCLRQPGPDGGRSAGRGRAVDVDAHFRASQGSHADARLGADARGMAAFAKRVGGGNRPVTH
jgi:hypothetical protein